MSGFKTARAKRLDAAGGDRARVDFELVVGGSSENGDCGGQRLPCSKDSGEVAALSPASRLPISPSMAAAFTSWQLSRLGRRAKSTLRSEHSCGRQRWRGIQRTPQNHNIYLLDGGEDDDRAAPAA